MIQRLFHKLTKTAVIGLLVLGCAIIASEATHADAASFARGKPGRVNRTDIGVRDQEVRVNFSAFNVDRLRSAFYGAKYKRVLPNSTRDALQRHRRQMIGKRYYLNAGDILPTGLLRESVLIPPSTYRFLGLAGMPNMQARILGTHIFLYDTRTGKIHDVLAQFLR